MSIDIKDFYLCTPMKRYEYFRMKLELFPEDIIQEYGLRNKVDATGNVHCEVRRGMCGLPKRASSHRNHYKSDYLRQDTAKARSHQDIGDTTGDPSASHWL
jgi:hypothetical protein